MKKRYQALSAITIATLAGCNNTLTDSNNKFSLSTYHAISPLSVTYADSTPDSSNYSDLPESEAGRFGMESYSINGGVNAANVATFNASGNSGQVINDYIMYRTTPLPIAIYRWLPDQNDKTRFMVEVADLIANSSTGTISVGASAVNSRNMSHPVGTLPIFEGVIPVYIGWGARIVADVSNSSVALGGSLDSVSASIQSNHATGTLSVESMGISGSTMGLMIQNSVALNDSTIQSALTAVASIKATLAAAYNNTSGSQTLHLHAEVIGFECSINDAQVIDAVRSHITAHQFSITRGTNKQIQISQVATLSDTGGGNVILAGRIARSPTTKP